MVSPRSLANLKPPFKPGQSGNPGGKPKGAVCFITRLKEALLSDTPWQNESIETFKRRVKVGDPQFWKMLLDQLDPEARAKVASMMGVNVNVSQSQAVAIANIPQEYFLSRLSDAECLVFRDLARKCSSPVAGEGMLPAQAQ
jgi:hypothetical protein